MYDKEYLKIDMEKTGALIRQKVMEQGYTVKDIQNYLQLSCPQPVYRWFKGKVLPSLDHLLILSRVLKVHMEDLLAVELNVQGKDGEPKAGKVICYDMQEEKETGKNARKQGQTAGRLWIYWEKLNIGAA